MYTYMSRLLYTYLPYIQILSPTETQTHFMRPNALDPRSSRQTCSLQRMKKPWTFPWCQGTQSVRNLRVGDLPLLLEEYRVTALGLGTHHWSWRLEKTTQSRDTNERRPSFFFQKSWQWHPKNIVFFDRDSWFGGDFKGLLR